MCKTLPIASAALSVVALLAAGLAPAAPPPRPIASGEQLFVQNCVACHQAAGQGIPGAFPALARDKFVTGDPVKVVQVLLNGRGGMPTFRESLSDAEIAAVASYARNNWGNKAPPIPVMLVTRIRGGKASSLERPIPGH